jgi:hypothetical protein
MRLPKQYIDDFFLWYMTLCWKFCFSLWWFAENLCSLGVYFADGIGLFHV